MQTALSRACITICKTNIQISQNYYVSQSMGFFTLSPSTNNYQTGMYSDPLGAKWFIFGEVNKKVYIFRVITTILFIGVIKGNENTYLEHCHSSRYQTFLQLKNGNICWGTDWSTNNISFCRKLTKCSQIRLILSPRYQSFYFSNYRR